MRLMTTTTTVFLLLLSFSALAQEKAMTESGKKILLYPDGTWKPAQVSGEASIKPGAYSRPASSTAKAEINRGKYVIYYNPKKWKPKGDEEGGRSTFNYIGGDGGAVIIAERLQIPLESLKAIALENAKEAAPDAAISFEEMRNVNGKEVLALQMKATMKSIPFQYYGYYYSDKNGAIQVLTYTGQNLFDEYKKDLEDFLNGFMAE